jgi:hypothetical protein
MSATTALAAAPDESGNHSVDNGPNETVPEIFSPPVVDAPPDEAATSPALSHHEREEALARIKHSNALPPALRDRLAALVELSGNGQMPLDACLQAIEESLPDFLQVNRAEAAQPPHPAGEVFFRGSSSELTEADAEALAHQQLSRSGLLRGQRVRVAD